MLYLAARRTTLPAPLAAGKRKGILWESYFSQNELRKKTKKIFNVAAIALWVRVYTKLSRTMKHHIFVKNTIRSIETNMSLGSRVDKLAERIAALETGQGYIDRNVQALRKDFQKSDYNPLWLRIMVLTNAGVFAWLSILTWLVVQKI